MTGRPTEVKKFTGYHAAAIIVAFFAVVVCVNMVMARFALSTFSGTVVDNSYVASQKYNDWLAEARTQQAHGWTVSPALRKADKATITITTAASTPLQQATMTGIAEHPIGQADPFEISFTQASSGEFHSVEKLPAGRWKLKIIITQDGKDMRVVRDIW
ncbi:FixH family protein [uncultured Parasphingorhabdus sp.]|uniref:FixH family protein n=1 Tax=uncultured Parasphingorhabdus sp. TaxID=2709694 RepID=UPI0030D7A685|tara:strand:- start:34019 stop:34495 length:477 start_codon:yes stop_codon:yes gene_type:complete